MTCFTPTLLSSLTMLFRMIKLNQISWTAGSDHILCATEGSYRCGDLEVIAFRNHDLILVEAIQAHPATCEKLAVDRRYFITVGLRIFLQQPIFLPPVTSLRSPHGFMRSI